MSNKYLEGVIFAEPDMATCGQSVDPDKGTRVSRGRFIAVLASISTP
jgi:hypothetical protein